MNENTELPMDGSLTIPTNEVETVNLGRFIDLLIETVVATGISEGVWYGLSNDEQKELINMIRLYDRITKRETSYILDDEGYFSDKPISAEQMAIYIAAHEKLKAEVQDKMKQTT